VTKGREREGQGFNCETALASVLLKAQFKSDMERGGRDRESLVAS